MALFSQAFVSGVYSPGSCALRLPERDVTPSESFRLLRGPLFIGSMAFSPLPSSDLAKLVFIPYPLLPHNFLRQSKLHADISATLASAVFLDFLDLRAFSYFFVRCFAGKTCLPLWLSTFHYSGSRVY